VLPQEGRGKSLALVQRHDHVEAVPRHTEVANKLAKKICRALALPEIGK